MTDIFRISIHEVFANLDMQELESLMKPYLDFNPRGLRNLDAYGI